MKMRSSSAISLMGLLVFLSQGCGNPGPVVTGGMDAVQGIHYYLKLDNEIVGEIHAPQGGGAIDDGTTAPKYQDVTITSGAELSPAFWEWINASISNKHERKNGAVVAVDADFNAVSELNFFEALVTEVGFPSADGSDKSNGGKITLTFTPSSTQVNTGPAGQTPPQRFKDFSALQAPLVSSRIKFNVLGLETSSAAVDRVQPVTIKQDYVADPSSSNRDSGPQVGKIEYSDLVVGIPANQSNQFDSWFQDVIVNGKTGPNEEKTGSLVYFNAQGQAVLELDFAQLSIFDDSIDPVSRNATTPHKTVKMHCDNITVIHTPSAAIKPI